MEHVVAEPEPIRDAGAPALDEHLGPVGERQQLLACRPVVEIELDAALAAVEDRHGFRRAPPQRIAAGWFHPHDVGAVVGEQPGGAWSGGPAGAVDHPESLDRPDHASHHAEIVQAGACRCVVAELLEHLVGVLAEGRGGPHRELLAGDEDRDCRA